MDLHHTASSAPVCDAELSLAGAFEPPAAVSPRDLSPAFAVEPPSPRKTRYAHPDADVRIAERDREEEALDALEAQITEVWGHINAATARFLTLVAEFDRNEGWARHGLASCAQWLNWQCGIGRVAAREKVRTARALESLPKIAAAFGEGRLSYSKVRALTRVATAETEDTLLHIALNGTAAHVERTVRCFRRVQRETERSEADAIHERRYLSCRREYDGSFTLQARLTPEAGELLLKALQAAEAQLEERAGDAEAGESVPPCESVSAETPPRSVCQRRADALEQIVQRFLAGGGSRSSAGAHELVVHIAHDALPDVPKSSGAAFDNGHGVAVETARRLGCDGALVGVVEGAQGEPLAVGRRTRAVPPAIRRALRVRDGDCRFPGCDRSRFVQAHHIRHWADGGETTLDNLVTLCSFHHRLVHEGGYGVRVRGDAIEFTRPDGRVIPPAGRAHEGCFRGNTSAKSGDACAANGAQRLKAFNTARGLAIDANTARCRWGGERMDYNIAIDALCWEAGHT